MSGPDQTQIPLVDQIGQGYTLILVLLGDGDNEAEVRANQLVQRLRILLPDRLGQTNP